jgi:hypothetical protein
MGPYSFFGGLKHKLWLKDFLALKLRKHKSNDLWLEHVIDSWKDLNKHYKIMGSYAKKNQPTLKNYDTPKIQKKLIYMSQFWQFILRFLKILTISMESPLPILDYNTRKRSWKHSTRGPTWWLSWQIL